MNNEIQVISSEVEAIKAALFQLKRVLTFTEGCQYTGFAPSYMYKLTSAGLIPFSKPNGKTIFFDREKLDGWLLSNCRSSYKQKDTLAATYVNTHQ